MKYLSNGKEVKLSNEIDHFVQLEKEFFWKCFEKCELLLAQCPTWPRTVALVPNHL